MGGLTEEKLNYDKEKRNKEQMEERKMIDGRKSLRDWGVTEAEMKG